MQKIKKLISKIYYYLPIKFILKDIVLFESNPDFCDNTRGVYDRMLELGYNKKMKLVWFVSNSEKFNDIKIDNVEFVDYKDKKKIRYYRMFAKYIIDCNNFIFKRNKNQLRIHLTHGTPIKFAGDYCKECGDLDYVIQVSDYFTDITRDLFNVPKNKIKSTGFPRNDIILNKNNKQVFFKEIKRHKTICWFPTYRNHKNHSSGKTIFPYGIPTVSNEKELKKLDNILEKEKILLVIKLHPVEDVSTIKKLNLNNIKLVEDDIFDKDHSTLYHYLSNIDALITDYSSVYYDFLLTGKPIGLAISDLKDYLKTTKIIFDNYEEGVAGEYIYNFDDLIKFIYNVSTNNDISKERRMEKIKIYHKYLDNKSADRVIELMSRKGTK